VLLWGGAEVVTPKLASSDLQFLANRKFSCTEICAAFGVPEEIITTTNAAKYDVMSGARLNFIENRVVPLCRRLEAEDDVTVKSIDPTADGWFDPEDHPVLAAARRDRLAAARTGFDMGSAWRVSSVFLVTMCSMTSCQVRVARCGSAPFM